METTFRTPYTSMAETKPVAEKVIGKSETLPDQSLSVRDILQKFANGTLDEIANDAFYSEDLPDLRGLDITELEEMKRDAQMDIDEIEAMIKLHEQTTGNQESNPSPSDTPITETPELI
ncbi:hypothetical protein [Elizabethkingia miricola]|uniref:hypothetical protein n=1 Tax=Elizabethkingia miricola TaxID=172045 RepID=UPI00389287F1